MIEPAKKIAFDAKALFPRAANPSGMNELDGDDAFVQSIGSMRSPNAAHPAAANFRVDDVGSDLAPDQGGFADPLKIDRGACQKSRKTLARPCGERSRHPLSHLGVAFCKQFEPLGPLLRVQIKGLIEEPA